MTDKKYYTDLFEVTERQLETLAAEGIAEGGSYCDLFFENTCYNELLLRDGAVSSGGFHIDYGVGIRVLKGDRTGYAYSDSTDAESMSDAAKAAAKIAEASMPGTATFRTGGGPKARFLVRSDCPLPRHTSSDTPWKDFSTARHGRFATFGSTRTNPFILPGNPGFYPFAGDWRSVEASSLVPYLERLESRIMAKDNRIVKIIISLTSQISDILMYNSSGELTYDTRPLGTLAISSVFSQDGRIENSSTSRSFRKGTEMLSEGLLDELADDAVRGIDERFAAKRPRGGQMPVVMGAGASGILLHEAMGHAFEADFNRKGQSIFSEKMGQKICDAGISVIDDGTIAGNRGAVNFDDEGIPGQKTFMVEDGVLTSYLHDRISAARYGVAPTGNGRRESFRYAPMPRMRATYMASGNAGKEDLIASVKKGIYVDQFSNGQVQIGEGDFTFFVKSGFLIENGRLTRPVKDINIIGNGPQALADITGVGNDLKVDDGAWTCGKGQSCPVSCGIPSVLIKNLTVGGE